MLELEVYCIKAEQAQKMYSTTPLFTERYKTILKPLVQTTLEPLHNLVSAEVKALHKIESQLSTWQSSSGITEKHRRSQTGDDKIMVSFISNCLMANNGDDYEPHIEADTVNQSGKRIEIQTRDELKIPFIVRHVETLLKEIMEDYTMKNPVKTAIGFQPIATIAPG